MNNAVDDPLKSTRVGVLYEQSIPSLSASFITTFILIYVLWGQVPTARLLIWFFIFLFITGIRFFTIFHYYKSDTKQNNQDSWLRLYITFTIISGLLWGLSGQILMLVDSVLYTGFLLMCICGLLAGSISSYSVFHSVFYAFSVPVIIPFLIYLNGMNGAEFNTMILLFLFFSSFMIVIEFRTHKIINNSISLQHNNTLLIDHLDEQEFHSTTLQKRVNSDNQKIAEIEDELKMANITIHQLEDKLNQLESNGAKRSQVM